MDSLVPLISSLLLPLSILLPQPLLVPFLLSFTFMFSLMQNPCSFLSSPYLPWRHSLSFSYPRLLLSLHRSPLLSQSNSSDLSEHFYITRGEISRPGRASAFCYTVVPRHCRNNNTMKSDQHMMLQQQK